MLSIVIPVKDVHELTIECISMLYENAEGELDIIVVDNGSTTPVRKLKALENVNIIENSKNVGFWHAMMQGIAVASSNYVLLMHNDVFIWEKSFDRRIIEEFVFNDRLGAVGLFGGRGVGDDGGRGHPEGNMQGLRYGTPQHNHGHLLKTEHPAVVFDSLAICIDKRKLNAIDPITVPPHHWTDRIICLRLIRAGFHCMTVGIAFDHGGSATASTESMDTFSEDWCKSKGLELDKTWENTLYQYGASLFRDEFLKVTGGRSQLWVDKDFKYYVR